MLMFDISNVSNSIIIMISLIHDFQDKATLKSRFLKIIGFQLLRFRTDICIRHSKGYIQ